MGLGIAGLADKGTYLPSLVEAALEPPASLLIPEKGGRESLAKVERGRDEEVEGPRRGAEKRGS